MAALAFKALAYGADKIPDRVFEVIPGGYFKATDKKKSDIKKQHDRASRTKSEERYNDKSRRRRSDRQRHRSPSTDYSEYSGYDDTDYERDYRDRQRHRTKSLNRGMSPDESSSRGRYRGRDTDDRDLDAATGNAERGPQFSPLPNEYRPYNPADYAPSAAAPGAPSGNDYYDRRSSSVQPEYNPYSQQHYVHPGAPQSSFAARYTPNTAYAPSPVNAQAAPPNPEYPPYNPADYVTPAPGLYRAPGNAYPSPPPFYRQSSRSQPLLEGVEAYPQPYATASNRHDSSLSKKHRRARSAGHHRSRSRVTDQLRDRFNQLDLDANDKRAAASTAGALAGGLAGSALGNGTLSTIIGVAVGSYGARQLEKRHEKKKEPRGKKSEKREPSRDRDRSRRRSSRHDYPSDGYESYSDSETDGHRRSARRRGSRGRKESF